MAFQPSCYYSNVDLLTEMYILIGLTTLYLLSAAWLIFTYKNVLKRQNIKLLKVFAALNILQLSFVIASVIFDNQFTGDLKIKALINNLKSTITYPVFQSMYLAFYMFLFKFKSIEIQIDYQHQTVVDVISRMKYLKRIIKISIIALLILKIFFIAFWAVANIVVIFNPEMLQFQLIMKTVLIAINTPVNLLIAYLIVYFYKMGLRFISYIEKVENEESEHYDILNKRSFMQDQTLCNKILKALSFSNIILTFLFMLYLIYVANNIVWFVYPLVLNYLDAECSQAFTMYKMISSYYYIIFSFLQGIFVVVITHYFMKGVESGEQTESKYQDDEDSEYENSQVDQSIELGLPMQELNQ